MITWAVTKQLAGACQKMKILTTGDIYGNKALIYRICEIAKKENIDALIIAGDVTPKGFYQFCKNSSEYDIRSVFILKNRKDILKGDEQQVRARLDLLGFVEVPKDTYNLSTIKTKQKDLSAVQAAQAGKLSEICKL